MEERLNLKYPLIVEGKYDKAKVSLVVSSSIIALDGFSIFNNKEKQMLLKKLSRSGGIILLTDSDRAGNFLRSKLKDMIKGQIFNVYTPAISGKERRKKEKSADGLLGVEGISSMVIYELLKPFSVDGQSHDSISLTKGDFYSDGFSGTENSSEMRARLARELSLPESLTSNALLEAINLLISKDEYETAVKKVKKHEAD